MLLAILLVGCAALVVIGVGLSLIRQALKVIHDAVNSNMTRALNEITQLHKDVEKLIRERNTLRTDLMKKANPKRKGQ